MTHDSNFYKVYAEYLKEPRVRKVHDRVLFLANYLDYSFKRVIDLGCGQGNEFRHHCWVGSNDDGLYVGIDHNVELSIGSHVKTLPADYRKIDTISSFIEKYELTSAVSLFSIECTASCAENYAFYEQLFRNTKIKSMLSSGFYYSHAKNQETIIENGNILYQTIENIESVVSSVFGETRIIVLCPSKLFGEDVIEVWKILERKNDE
jgi:hypothetical protein